MILLHICLYSSQLRMMVLFKNFSNYYSISDNVCYKNQCQSRKWILQFYVSETQCHTLHWSRSCWYSHIKTSAWLLGCIQNHLTKEKDCFKLLEQWLPSRGRLSFLRYLTDKGYKVDTQVSDGGDKLILPYNKYYKSVPDLVIENEQEDDTFEDTTLEV